MIRIVLTKKVVANIQAVHFVSEEDFNKLKESGLSDEEIGIKLNGGEFRPEKIPGRWIVDDIYKEHAPKALVDKLNIAKEDLEYIRVTKV